MCVIGHIKTSPYWNQYDSCVDFRVDRGTYEKHFGKQQQPHILNSSEIFLGHRLVYISYTAASMVTVNTRSIRFVHSSC